MVEIAQDFAGGFYRLHLNRSDVGKVETVFMLGRMVAVTYAEKIFRHAPASRGLMPRAKI
jgi:hypothetical protein